MAKIGNWDFGKFKFQVSEYLSSGKISSVKASYLQLSSSKTSQITGTLALSGNMTVSGDLQTSGSFTPAGHIMPNGDETYDLGSSELRWRNIYTGDLHLRNERGDWTIVEEEDHLMITNNKKGKKYKFVLEEID